MYHVMAIANYEDRFVIPSTHREYAENTFDMRGGCGFTFGNGCSTAASTGANLFSAKTDQRRPHGRRDVEFRRVHKQPKQPEEA